MNWLEVAIVATDDRQAEISDALEACGALAVTTADAGDTPVLEPPPGALPLWPTVRVTGLFEGDADPRVLVVELGRRLGTRLEIEHRTVADQDWTRAWMDRFQPLRIGTRLLVQPSHLPMPAEPPQAVVVMDPGLAFGTGGHPTTALCLEFLEACSLVDATVLDFGCGSGILAIAALKLGAGRALCVDNDPQALDATRENARRNGVGGRLVATPALESGQEADVVVANILAGPLVDLAPRLAAHCRPGGRLALSGVLAEQRPQVENVYRDAFTDFEHRVRDGWVLMTATRRD